MSTLITAKPKPTEYHGNGRYVRAHTCDSNYTSPVGVSACVLSGSVGAMAWIGMRGWGESKPYVVCWIVDSDTEKGEACLGRAFLTKRELEKAFATRHEHDMEQNGRCQGAYVRRGRELVFSEMREEGGPTFSVYVTDDMRQILAHFLNRPT